MKYTHRLHKSDVPDRLPPPDQKACIHLQRRLYFRGWDQSRHG